MKAVVTERGEVTIPAELGQRLGLRPGEVVELDVRDGHVVVERDDDQQRSPADEIAHARGVLRDSKLTTSDAMLLVRGVFEPE